MALLQPQRPGPLPLLLLWHFCGTVHHVSDTAAFPRAKAAAVAAVCAAGATVAAATLAQQLTLRC